MRLDCLAVAPPSWDVSAIICMSNQFQPVARQGQRKASNEQFRANYDLISRPKPKVVRADNACKGKDDTCKAYAVSGEELCAGHLRSKLKAEGVTDEEG